MNDEPDLVETKVKGLRWCDFCGSVAHYDAKTKHGPWANMCEEHFETEAYSQKLGLGLGQRFIYL